MTENWERCPSTHCERAQECRSPHECSGTGRRLAIHVDAAEKRAGLPELAPEDSSCPHCGGELQTGFGLAGGGFGPYTYCEACRKVTSKTEVWE